jgi:biopolymer transport protein ExbD
MGVQLDVGGGKRQLRPTINVTPLVDVVLVLLIIFMVVIPNMQEHKVIELFPTTNATEDGDDEKQAIVVTLAEDGSLHLAKAQVTRPALLAELRRIKAEDPDRKILLRADIRLPYREVRSLFYDVKELGHANVKLAVGAVQEDRLSLGELVGGEAG